MGQLAEPLHGFVLRKTRSHIYIKFRAGNVRRLKITKALKILKLGQKLKVGFDYEKLKIANVWTEEQWTELTNNDSTPEEKYLIHINDM